ncbi:MAG: nitrogenase component 1, partial [Altererythrobacter ishigakiensis]|nr:nitrogenase component 1 [Altererythrobacter ishigakiensis]
MQLAVWTYEGPPHVGAMRVATGMKDMHYLLHAPQGDTYADLLFTMIERRGKRPPVTYTTFQARDLGKDTAELFQQAARDALERFKPQALMVGASCTAELIQDDPAGLADAMRLDCPVIPLELPSYQRKENWGAAESFYQIVRKLADQSVRPRGHERKLANILGPAALGFRHRDDVVEVRKMLEALDVEVNLVGPMGATPADITQIGRADFNIVLYPEIGDEAARWLERTFKQPTIRTVPIGVGATREFIMDIATIAEVNPGPLLADTNSRMP